MRGGRLQPRDRGDRALARTAPALLEPGDDEIGWTARRGRVPLGYLDDRSGTEATFPIVDGERVAVPGDRAQLLADGTIRMLGRDSMVVNTGGEKVFVEEVEARAASPTPTSSTRSWSGARRTASARRSSPWCRSATGASVEPADLREHVASRIARFKAPRAVVVCDSVHRHANGKADYRWAHGGRDRRRRRDRIGAD